MFDILALILAIAGAFFLFVGSIGVVRLPDFYTRTHAVGKSDTLGLVLAILGITVHGGDATASDNIKLKAPDIAENGAVVPITVTSKIDGTTHMSILVAKNNTPLTSTYELGPTTEAYISTRVKMGKTSDVIAVVKAGGKLYSTKKEVKVTIGGCGG